MLGCSTSTCGGQDKRELLEGGGDLGLVGTGVQTVCLLTFPTALSLSLYPCTSRSRLPPLTNSHMVSQPNTPRMTRFEPRVSNQKQLAQLESPNRRLEAGQERKPRAATSPDLLLNACLFTFRQGRRMSLQAEFCDSSE